MPAQRFRPRDLQKDSNLEDVRRQLNQIQVEIGRDLDTLFRARKQGEVITASVYAAAFGEVARFGPPSGGTRLILPEPNPAALDSRITAVVEAASGALSVEVVNGTINGASTLSYLAGIGTVEFILTATGWYAWSVSLVASLPLTALAAQAANTVVANATAASASPTAFAVGANTVLGRVAGNIVAAALVNAQVSATAAIVLSKLADGSALSVVGRSANSTGAHTDITATAASDAVLRESGSALGFGTVATGGIADAAVTLAKMESRSARRILGRADSAGTGAPQSLTGAQVGEIVRFANRVQDATSTGTIVTYTLTEATNVIDFAAGIGALTLRGATIPAESGQVIVWGNGNTGVNVTFNDEDASAASAGERFRTPGAVALVLAPNHRAVSVYTGSRHKFIATA